MLSKTLLALTLAATTAGSTIQWHQGDLGSALASAGERDALVAVYFWRNGSDYCAEFYQNTLGDARVVEALQGYVNLSAQHATTAGDALFERYGVTTLPTLLFLRPDGAPEDAIAGFATADVALDELDRIGRGELTRTDLERQIADSERGTEEHFELRRKLAAKLGDVGDADGRLATYEAIAKDDRRGKTLAGCQVLMELCTQDISESDGGEEKIAEWDLKPLHVLARKLKHDEGRFEVWNRIGELEAHRKNVSDACKAWRKANETVPEDRAMGWSGDVAGYILYLEGELSSADKEFVLELARRSADLAAASEGCECPVKPDCGCKPVEVTQAYHLATLAYAYELNGDLAMAKETAARSVELDPRDENRERLADFL